MGFFRFAKRIRLFGGLGINLGKKGASISLRTPLGSLSSKGASVRTGIPGLTYRIPFSEPKPDIILPKPTKHYRVELSDGTHKYLTAVQIAQQTQKTVAEIEQLYSTAPFQLK
jgi:hypothetical protein